MENYEKIVVFTGFLEPSKIESIYTKCFGPPYKSEEKNIEHQGHNLCEAYLIQPDLHIYPIMSPLPSVTTRVRLE